MPSGTGDDKSGAGEGDAAADPAADDLGLTEAVLVAAARLAAGGPEPLARLRQMEEELDRMLGATPLDSPSRGALERVRSVVGQLVSERSRH